MTVTKLIACASALVITSFSIFTASEAASVENPNNSVALSTQFIELAKENTLEATEYTDGLTSVQSIKNVDTLITSIKDEYPSISDYQLGKTVLMSLGDDENFVNSLTKDKILEAVEYTEVKRTTVYLREIEDGSLIQISKDDYEADKAASTHDISNTSKDSSSISTQATIPDYEEKHGDILLCTTAYKRSPTYSLSGRDYFSIRGEVIWEGYPNISMTDLLVISSSGNIDNQYDHDAFGAWYDSYFSDTKYDIGHLYSANGGDGRCLKLSSPNMYGTGVSFPITAYTYGDYYTVQHVYAYYGVSAQTDITCQVSYAHAILGWTPSFSISTSGSVSFGGIGAQRQTFYGTPITLYHS